MALYTQKAILRAFGEMLEEIAAFCRYAYVGFSCNSCGTVWRQTSTAAWTGWGS